MNDLRIKRQLGNRYLTILLFGIFISSALVSGVLAGPDAELYDLLERFHGHTCAGSIFGARLGYAAKAAMGDHGKLKAQYFNLSCPVDGIQFAAGTTYGNRALEIIEQDDHRLILIDTKSGKKVEARLTEQALEKGKAFREISSKLRSLDSESDESIMLKKEKESVLDWLKTAPDSQVVNVQIIL